MLTPPNPGCDNSNTRESNAKPELRVSSVLFVEQSKGGSLAQSVMNTVRRLSPMLGFTIKVVENAGSSLGSVLSNKNPWAGQVCGRPKCPPCAQGEEVVEDCKATNVLYESVCKDCNPGKKPNKNSSLHDDRAEASIYVGETSRSLSCRSTEHQRDYKTKKEDSHMVKHWITTHQGQEKPKFIQRVVNTYKSALERQVGEAVRIQLRGNTLNSLCGFNRSKVTRMVIDKEWDAKIWRENFDQRLISSVLADDDDIDVGTVRNAKRRLEGNKDDEEQVNTQLLKKRKIEDRSTYRWGMELNPDIDTKEVEARHIFLKSGPAVIRTPAIQTTLFQFNGPEMWCRELVLKSVTACVNIALEKEAEKEISVEIAASNRLFEDEGDWECPESRAETSARRAKEKTERTLWKLLDDLDIKVQKADLKLAKDQARKKAAESVRATKARIASETSRKITSFFKKSKERQPPTRDSHHVSDWEMEDLDPSSALEMLWDDTPALTSAQVELLNNKRDRAMRLRLAKRKKAEAVEKHRRKQELEEMADHLKSVLVTRLFDMLDEETLIPIADSDLMSARATLRVLAASDNVESLSNSGNLTSRRMHISWSLKIEIQSLDDRKAALLAMAKEWLWEILNNIMDSDCMTPPLRSRDRQSGIRDRQSGRCDRQSGNCDRQSAHPTASIQ